MKLLDWIKLKIKQNFKCEHQLTPSGRMRYSDFDGFTFMFQKQQCIKCGKVKDIHVNRNEWESKYNSKYKW
jgi:hypothetical protein